MGKNTQEKPSLLRVTREFSAGGAVYKKSEMLWLIRSTMPSPEFPKSYWMLPKGWIDEGEKLEETAIREVKEEGGVEAKIIKKLQTVKYFFKHPSKGNILKFVTFFLMEYVKDLSEGHDNETQEVLWLPYNEAYKKLSFGQEKQILKKAKINLEML